MKQYSLIFSLVFFSSLSFAQDFAEAFLKVDFQKAAKESSIDLLRQNFRYEVYPFHIPARPTSSTKLSTAKAMSDLIKEYPSSWVSDYVSTEISVVSNGKTKTAAGTNETLNKAQQELLRIADLNTKAIINIKYRQENAATRKVDVHNLNYQIAVVPDTEAKYSGGRKALKQYLKKNVEERISNANLAKIKEGVVQFVINEKGQVEAVQLSEKTGVLEVDQLLIKAIETMPLWEPAKDGSEVPVKQQFKFAAGNPFGGC